jgi:hypothetical protein
MKFALFFLLIILYIIIQQYLEKPKKIKKEKEIINTNQPINTNQIIKSVQKVPPTIQEFYKPNPWSKIVTDPSSEYPYNFYIKIKIPSLNDYEDWKQVIPNLDFNARTGELIIPSKDEPSALAIANLISSNFSGHLSLKEILDKNLIQISIGKARNYELVQHKFREQIIENLFGAPKPQEIKEYKEEKTTKPIPKNQNISSDDFVDTFQHFTYNQIDEGVNAYDNLGYSAF